MAGHIRTLQKCPKCKGPFPKDFLCPHCLTRPTRFFIDLWWRGERLKLYTDPYGFPLDSLVRAEQLLATIRYQIGTGKFDPKEYVAKEVKSLQFEHYVAAWLTRRQAEVERRDISRGYLKHIERYAANYFVPFFGRMNIRDIRDGHIKDFRNQLPEHLSAKTVMNILGVLHKLLAEALDRKDIAVMPRFPRVPKREPDIKWLTPEEQARILARCREPYRTMFLLCMKQGCRLGEARALKWDCVHLKGKPYITFEASMDLGEWKPYTKDGSVRKIPLNAEVKEALLGLPRSISGFVFVNREGRPLSDVRTRKVWMKAAQQAGVDISAYQGTRHSFATQKLLAGYSERMVMEATGHKTVSAFRRYGKMVAEALRDMIDASMPTVRTPSAEGESD